MLRLETQQQKQEVQIISRLAIKTENITFIVFSNSLFSMTLKMSQDHRNSYERLNLEGGLSSCSVKNLA